MTGFDDLDETIMRSAFIAMISGMCLSICAAAAADAGAGADAPPASHRVLLQGEFHGDEVVHAPTGDWWALVREAGGSRLLPTAIRIESVVDSVHDHGQGPVTGKRVLAAAAPAAIVLISGPDLGAGAVDEAETTGDASGWAAKTFTLRGRSYRLALEDGCVDRRQPCSWLLSEGGHRQVVHQLRVSRDGKGAVTSDSDRTGVQWAGDLDADGRLDLVLEASDHENAVAHVRVYLSSAAGPGELVGLAGAFRAVGC